MSLRPLSKDEITKWKIKCDYQPKTNATMYALHSVAQHWVEHEILIEKAAEEEVKQNLPQWTPEDDDQIGEYMAEKGLARIMHDDIMVPMHRYRINQTEELRIKH